MRFLILALSLLTATWAAPPSYRHEPAIAHGETLNEASANVRRLLHEVPYGSIATVFPHHEAAVGEWRRAGDPFAMLEYREVYAVTRRSRSSDAFCCQTLPASTSPA